jgi:hypothetical protein
MGKPDISVGDDTSTGEPANGPRGPYITDEDDGSRPSKTDKPPMQDETPAGASKESRSPPGAKRTDY